MNFKPIYQGPNEGVFEFGYFYQLLSLILVAEVKRKVIVPKEQVGMTWQMNGLTVNYDLQNDNVVVGVEGTKVKIGDFERILAEETRRKKEKSDRLKAIF